MAISKGTWVATSGNQTTGFTLTVPAAVVANDICVIGITNRDATANPTCVDNEGAGTWARLTTVNANTNGSISIWWKRASANTNGKTVTVGGCTGSASGALGYYRGASISSSPFGTPVGEGNASTDESQAGITTARDGSMVIHLVGCTSNDTLAPGNRTATTPTTITEDAEGVSSGGSDCSMSFASDIRSTAGATGTISWSQTDGTGASLAVELLAAIDTLTASSGSFTMTGTAAVLKYNRKIVADSGSYAMTGTDASLKRNYPLTADSGAFAVTGTSASFARTYILVAASGSFAVTGTDAAPNYNRKINADSGSFAVTGTAADLVYEQGAQEFALVADSGAFAVTGTDATLKYNRKVVADSGSYAVTGTAATLKYGRVVVAGSGSYSVTGTDTTLKYGRLLVCDSGVFTEAGTDAALKFGRVIVAASGSYVVTGTAATLTYAAPTAYVLTAAAGAYTIAGTAATPRYSRIFAVESGSFTLTGTAADLVKFHPPPRPRQHSNARRTITRLRQAPVRWTRVIRRRP